MRNRVMRNRYAAIALLAAELLCGCGPASRGNAATLTDGNPDRGISAIAHYGCGSCHFIPGISGAHGLVGPPLSGIKDRIYVAGSLHNNSANLRRWIQGPHEVNQQTAMPDLGVTAQDANDIVAYLYSLR
jgi:cytochrome c